LTATVQITRPLGVSLGTMPGDRVGMMRPAAARSVWMRLALPLVVMVLLSVAAAVVLVPGLLDTLQSPGSTPDTPVIMPTGEARSQADFPAPAEPMSVPAPSEPLEASANAAPVRDPAAATAETAGAQAPASAPPTAAPAMPPSASGTLELLAREESWVEVRDAPGGKVVFSRLMTPGMRERLSLPTASVVVGNAKGMEVRWNGSALDLSTQQRNNVARINLP
jgi:cytoskeleton protein RodZ